MNNKIVVPVAVAIIGVGVGFFGGIKYQQFKGGAMANFANMTAEQRQATFQQFRGGTGGNTARRGGTGGQFINGDILSKDDKSITVTVMGGGSKIIFFSPSTSIGKTTEGTQEDLAVGKRVMVSGNTNSDGSVTAQSIQIRPDMPAGSNTNPPAPGAQTLPTNNK